MNVEEALVQWLSAQTLPDGSAVRAVTRTELTLAQDVPLTKLTSSGGPEAMTKRRDVVTAEHFASSRLAASDYAEAVHRLISRQFRGQFTSPAGVMVVNGARTNRTPAYEEYDDTLVYRYVSIYTVQSTVP